MDTTTRIEPPSPGRPGADALMRRLLFIPEAAAPPTDSDVERLFSSSLALSATRCIFTYMVLPVVVPAVGALAGFGPVIGGLLSALALVFDVRAIRAFWWARDSRRWTMTWLYLVVIAFVLFLLAIDLGRVHP